jgi:hypothetical protein
MGTFSVKDHLNTLHLLQKFFFMITWLFLSPLIIWKDSDGREGWAPELLDKRLSLMKI